MQSQLLETSDTQSLMAEIGRAARRGARAAALAPSAVKDAALRAAAREIRLASAAILKANALDVEAARASGASPAALDRLTLDPKRIEAMARGVEQIADLPDPVGRVLAVFERPNGLRIERVTTPLGVIGVIYESRPNVTADAGALCLKSGNATILRGGSDSSRSSAVIHRCLVAGLESAGLSAEAIALVPTTDRAAVGAMLAGLDGDIDVIVPRGGKSLVARVQHEARVPVFAHLEGIVHVYVHGAADLEMAKNIVLNAKMRRTGVCGAAETLLVDRACAATHLAPLVDMLLAAGCAVRGDAATLAADSRVTPASEQDWDTEYLDAIIAVRVVDGLDDAMTHIAAHGSHHTDCIV
ncbi:MAG TPA: glutamate-5-semialdehyde dehydrogenase, partial [Methylocystis sp.]